MVKKLKAQSKDEDKLFASAVRTSAQQIWQAGLGAFAKAQEEGGQVFNKLVQEGTEMQKRAGSTADDRVADMTDTVTRVADGVSREAAGSWDKLEQVFEERVARALGAIGVPTRNDIEALTRQVEQLSRMVEQLTGQQVPAARKPAAKAARKVATKAAPRKPAAKKAGAAPTAGD
jgi:poly(hydroxyalkanoate) granule-associated protein